MFISIVVEHCNPIIFYYMDDDDVMRNIWVWKFQPKAKHLISKTKF